MKKRKYYKNVFKYLLSNKFYLFFYVAMAILMLVTNTLSPLFSAKLLAAITNMDVDVIILNAILVSGTVIISEFVFLGNGFITQKFETEVVLKMKADVAKELFRLEIQNFDKEGTGFFSSRINTEPNRLLNGMVSIIRYDIPNLLSSAGVLFFVYIISYQIGLLFTLFSLLRFISSHIYLKKMKENRKKIDAANDNYYSNFAEVIRGIRDIKVLHLKDKVLHRVTSEQKKLAKDNNAFGMKSQFHFFSTSLLDVTMDLGFIFLGIYLVMHSQLSAANFLILYMYRGKVTSFFRSISSLYNSIIDFNLSSERLYEIIDDDKYPMEKFGDVHLKLNGKIEMKDLSFGYHDETILNHINLTIEPNDTVGFVGKSGQGKTTIFNLLSKLYRVENQQLFLDGHDINDLTEDSIRNNISVITQNPYIFNMSIMDNLKLANENATEKDIIEKCQLCALDEFVQTLEKKYDTVVGEGGVILSGGQRQRLAIARALLKNSEIILLDEATSSLDNETQDYIHHSIKKISKDYTILIIAHRLTTIRDCKKIVVIDKGKIVGIGTHEELINQNPIYQNLYKKELL